MNDVIGKSKMRGWGGCGYLEVSDTSSSDARLYLIEAEMMIVNGIIGKGVVSEGRGVRRGEQCDKEASSQRGFQQEISSQEVRSAVVQ